MATKEVRFCTPCQIRGISATGVRYCVRCQELLCKDCVECHKAFIATKDHHMVQAFTDVFHGEENIQICAQHATKRTEFYCDNHKTFVCSHCLLLTESHKYCSKVLEIESAGKHFCKRKITEDIENSSIQLLESAQSAINEIKQGNKCTSESLNGLRCEIEIIRFKMLKAFDRQTDHITEAISSDIIQNKRDCERVVQNLIQFSKRITKNVSLLKTALDDGDNALYFRSAVLTNNHFDQFKQELEWAKGHCSTLKLSFEKSDVVKRLMVDENPLIKCGVEKVTLALQDVPSNNFEEVFEATAASIPTDVVVSKHDNKEVLKNTKDHEPSNRIKETKSIHALKSSSDDVDAMPQDKTGTSHKANSLSRYDVELSYSNSFDVKPSGDKQPAYTGIACLHDERLVLSDSEMCRLIIVKNNSFVTDNRIEFRPGNLSVFNQYLLVCLVNGNELKEHRHLSTRFLPKCVQVIDEKRFIVSSKNGRDSWCIEVKTLNGQRVINEVINVDIHGYLEGSRIAVQQFPALKESFRIIQCSEESKSMKCLSENGKEEWLCRDVEETTSVVTDLLGYVYVIRFPGEIQVFSQDGHFVTSICLRAMRRVKFAAFNKDMDKLFLTTYKDTTIHVINVRRLIL